MTIQNGDLLMNAVWQISRRFGRVTEAQTRSASSDCIAGTVSFGPLGTDPFWTPLMSAAEEGDLSRCKQLVAEGADINCFVMESEASAVTVALENGHEDVFFWLLDRGVELEHEQYCCDVCGMTYEITKETLLESAITGGCVNAIDALIARGADWDKCDQYGETPREYAKRIGFHMR